ncbi:MAG: hypothetical protein AAF654_04640, partial [Myxococcota bacterium]
MKFSYGWSVTVIVTLMGCTNTDLSTEAASGTEELAGARQVRIPRYELRPVEVCNNEESALAYEPQSGWLDTFPDNFHTEQAATATGRQVTLSARDLNLPRRTRIFHQVYDELATQDGFGVTSQLFVRMFADIDTSTLPVSGPGSASTRASVILFKVGAGTIEPVDFDWEVIDESIFRQMDQTLFLSPMRALEEQTTYALAVTTDLRDTDGGCIAPSEAMSDLLQGRAAGRFSGLTEDLETALTQLVAEQVIGDAGDLTGLFTFTTQSVSDDSEAMSALARSLGADYAIDGPCQETMPDVLECRGRLRGHDFRGSDGVIDDDSLRDPRPWNLPVIAWIPKSAPGP